MAGELKALEGDDGVPTLPLAEPASAGPWRVSAVPGGESGQPGAGGVRRGVTLAVGETILVGAHVGCQLAIDDPTISARHARLTATAEGVLVEDLGSKNGVYIAGARVERALLRAGDGYFSIGRTRVAVELARPRADAGELPLLPGLVGSSAPMRRLAAEIRRVAVLDAPVLLLGESGTGKDVVARALHLASGRRGRYVPLNAGGLGEALADSELFGHCRGAFTGAVQARCGAFELADRGTLLLDEVADLAPSIQVKLLRAVEDGEIRQLGGAAPVKVRTRLVTATWAPLERRIEAGTFRADLFHRISTFVIRVPPLRQRRSDIPALVRCLLRAREEELGPKYLSPGALELLDGYPFPGNVRELFSIVYRAAALGEGREVRAADIASALPEAPPTGAKPRLDARQLLDVHKGNVSAAARSAHVPRSTFRAWLRREEGADAPSGPAIAR
ncbi:MAG TPA: sigma 54-interacting transcriptional regulator [Polyangiaceae bacterium]|nr:sigma 54-interacting transcriptional regulator [Polyangiaceae bacterium]